MTVTLPISSTPVAIDFDPPEIGQRYEQERAYRLKPEALGQFQGVSDELELDSTDRYSAPLGCEPLSETLDAVALGGGFGGLLAGAHLIRNGVTDFRIIDQGGDFGGTWYWNRYPGVRCDLESYFYTPLLEQNGYVPTKSYADGAEIFEHAQRIGKEFDLYRGVLFQTAVMSTVWIEEDGCWEIRTDRSDALRARFLLRTNGLLNRPQVPGVRGINEFQGKSFTPVAGTTTTPAATPVGTSKTYVTNASPSQTRGDRHPSSSLC